MIVDNLTSMQACNWVSVFETIHFELSSFWNYSTKCGGHCSQSFCDHNLQSKLILKEFKMLVSILTKHDQNEEKLKERKLAKRF